MSEKLHQGKSQESALEAKERAEKLRNLPLENKNDLHTKEAFLSILPQIKPKIKEDVESLRKLVMELRERELSGSNFVSPENMLGLSTLVR